VCVCTCVLNAQDRAYSYRVATISRLPKTYVSFAKETYKKNHTLQKRPIFLRSLLIIAAPYCGAAFVVESFCVFALGTVPLHRGARLV